MSGGITWYPGLQEHSGLWLAWLHKVFSPQKPVPQTRRHFLLNLSQYFASGQSAFWVQPAATAVISDQSQGRAANMLYPSLWLVSS